MNLNKKATFIIIIIFVIIISSVLLLNNITDENSVDNSENTDIPSTNEPVVEESFDKTDLDSLTRYNVINSILTTYTSYLLADMKIETLYLLEENFIDDNNINSSNIDNYIEFYTDNHTYRILDIVEVVLTENVTAYLTEVEFTIDIINIPYNAVDSTINHYIIYIDESTLSYSIIPIIEEEYFSDTEDSSYLYQITNVKYTGYNQYSIYSPTEKDYAIFYFNNFKYYYLYHYETASNFIINEEKVYDITLNNIIENYSIYTDKKTIKIEDNFGLTYTFYINTLFDYSVEISS